MEGSIMLAPGPGQLMVKFNRYVRSLKEITNEYAMATSSL